MKAWNRIESADVDITGDFNYHDHDGIMMMIEVRK